MGAGLIGPNGSGKTTLLRAIGAHVPFEGEIVLDGRPVEARSASERARRLAYVQQRRGSPSTLRWRSWCCCDGPTAWRQTDAESIMPNSNERSRAVRV